MSSDVDKIHLWMQGGLAFLYALIFLVMFLTLVYFWEKLTKLDVGLLTLFATGSLNLAKDGAGGFFALRRQNQDPGSPVDTGFPTRPALTPANQPQRIET